MEIVHLPMLFDKVDLPIKDYPDANTLLSDLSSVISDPSFQGSENPLSRIKLTGARSKQKKKFLERVSALSPEDRLASCLPGNLLRSDLPHTIFARLVNGRALLVDPDDDQLIFGDDFIGWIRNGLWAMRSDPSALTAHTFGEFVPCSALTLSPCNSAVYDRTVKIPTIPALYVGDRFVNRAVAEWQSWLWFRDVKDGYSRAANELQKYWRWQVPNASEPDPVYRFILEPTARLRDEAILFLRQVPRIAGEQTGSVGIDADANGYVPDSDGQKPHSNVIEDQHLPTRPGYLGLQLDGARRIIKRAGYDDHVDLAHSCLHWAILEKLEEARDRFLPTDSLIAIWEAVGVARKPAPGTVDATISELRKKLRVLGIDILSVRKVGRRLTEMAVPKV